MKTDTPRAKTRPLRWWITTPTSDLRFMFKYCVRSFCTNHTGRADNLSPDSNYRTLADLGTPASHRLEIYWQVKAPPGLFGSPASGT